MLTEAETHEQRASLISGLPQSSLAILTFAVMMSLHILRTAGPEMVLYFTSPPNSDSRSEIELACEELILQRGPEFLLDLLMHKKDAISYISQIIRPTSCHADAFLRALKDEYYGMPSRQEPLPDGSPPPTTLIATLRRTFAQQCQCEIEFNLMHMWYVLDESCGALADSEERKVTHAIEKLVNGEPLEKGKRLLHCI